MNEAPDQRKKQQTYIRRCKIATARNNPFHVGGSENAQSDIDYIKKHSPWEGGGHKTGTSSLTRNKTSYILLVSSI